MSHFHAVHPVRDVQRSVAWYRDRLGFELLFAADESTPGYAGVGRDGVQIHLQWHSEEEWEAGLTAAVYRFLVDDPDALHAQVDGQGAVRDTEWGTREFGCYDPDSNALFFYRDL